MPVERRSGSKQMWSVVIAVGVLVIAAAGAWAVIVLASGGKGPVQVNLGADVFDAGQATRAAKQIDKDGPLLFSDVSGRGQRLPIYLNHTGQDTKTGWVAMNAAPPGAAEGCFLSWNAERNLFEERRADEGGGRDAGTLCRKVTWSADGSSGSDGSVIETFPWHIDQDGDLIVDLKPDKKADQPN
jgi:hypothetical protein